MDLLKIFIPTILIVFAILLIKYDRNKSLKERHLVWISRTVFRDNSGMNASAAIFHQTVLGFLFIFCIGIATLFVIGLFEEWFSK